MQWTGFIVLRHRQAPHDRRRHHKMNLNASVGVGSGTRLPVRVRPVVSRALVPTIALPRCSASRVREETVVLDQLIIAFILQAIARVATRMQETVAAARLSTLPSSST